MRDCRISMIVQRKFKLTIGLLVCSCIAFLLLSIWTPIVRADTASDFTSDVQKDLSSGAESAAVADIRTKEYQTSWDEFGTNVLTDGAAAPQDIQKSLTNDIVQDLQKQLTYNEEDQRYLQMQKSSPEEVLSVEGNTGDDISPQDYIDPNPSLEANPDVNPSALDMPASAVDTTTLSAPPDGATSAGEPSLSTSDTSAPPEDTLTPAEGEWNPDDIGVFQTILNADTADTADTPTDTSAQPEASPDAAPAPSPDAPTPDAPAPDAPAN